MPADTWDLVGRRLGAYQIEALMGVGTSSRIYRARHVDLDAPRSIRVVRPKPEDPQQRERFLADARIAARLSHPFIAPVLDYGSEGGVSYLVTPHFDSDTLSEYLERLPLQMRTLDGLLQRYLQEIAEALDYADGEGITHGDLKPSSVLLSGNGHALLADFGSSRALAVPSRSPGGAPPGTPAYMSPEQCQGTSGLTSASDRYSLAALLYEITCGQPPFGRDIGAVERHLHAPVPPVLRADGRVSFDLNAVFARGLAKSPIERYSIATELVNAFLEAAARDAAAPRLDETVMGVARPGKGSRIGRVRLTRVRVAIAALAVLIIAGAGIAGVPAVASAAHPAPPSPASPADFRHPTRGTVGKSLIVGGAQLTVLAPSQREEGDQRRILVTAQYRRVGLGPVMISPFDWELTDSKGGVYHPLDAGARDAMPQEELAWLSEAKGSLAFDVPGDAQGLVLRYTAELGDEAAIIPLP